MVKSLKKQLSDTITSLSTNEEKKEYMIGLVKDLPDQFFVAPASTKYHANWEGGLCQHTINLMAAVSFHSLYPESYEIDDMLLLALLHDIGKMDAYQKKEEGFERTLQFDEILETFYQIGYLGVELTMPEKIAVAFHHGGWTKHSRTNGMNDLATYLHCADLIATKVTEVEQAKGRAKKDKKVKKDEIVEPKEEKKGEKEDDVKALRQPRRRKQR